jgi:hypothetical protein
MDGGGWRWSAACNQVLSYFTLSLTSYLRSQRGATRGQGSFPQKVQEKLGFAFPSFPWKDKITATHLRIPCWAFWLGRPGDATVLSSPPWSPRGGDAPASCTAHRRDVCLSFLEYFFCLSSATEKTSHGLGFGSNGVLDCAVMISSIERARSALGHSAGRYIIVVVAGAGPPPQRRMAPNHAWGRPGGHVIDRCPGVACMLASS